MDFTEHFRLQIASTAEHPAVCVSLCLAGSVCATATPPELVESGGSADIHAGVSFALRVGTFSQSTMFESAFARLVCGYRALGLLD